MFKSLCVASAILAVGTPAMAQSELLHPSRVHKAAQELALYVRAGEVCGFRNHPGAATYTAFLRSVNREAYEMGFGSGSLMVDGMIARWGKARVCADAAKARSETEELFQGLN